MVHLACVTRPTLSFTAALENKTASQAFTAIAQSHPGGASICSSKLELLIVCKRKLQKDTRITCGKIVPSRGVGIIRMNSL